MPLSTGLGSRDARVLGLTLEQGFAKCYQWAVGGGGAGAGPAADSQHKGLSPGTQCVDSPDSKPGRGPCPFPAVLAVPAAAVGSRFLALRAWHRAQGGGHCRTRDWAGLSH